MVAGKKEDCSCTHSSNRWVDMSKNAFDYGFRNSKAKTRAAGAPNADMKVCRGCLQQLVRTMHADKAWEGELSRAEASSTTIPKQVEMKTCSCGNICPKKDFRNNLHGKGKSSLRCSMCVTVANRAWEKAKKRTGGKKVGPGRDVGSYRIPSPRTGLLKRLAPAVDRYVGAVEGVGCASGRMKVREPCPGADCTHCTDRMYAHPDGYVVCEQKQVVSTD